MKLGANPLFTLQASKPARQLEIAPQCARKEFDYGFLKAGIAFCPEKPGLGYDKRCTGHPSAILCNILTSGQRTILAKPLQRAQHVRGNNFEIGARDQNLHSALEQKVQIGPSFIQTNDPLALGECDQPGLVENALSKLQRQPRQPRRAACCGKCRCQPRISQENT